MIGLFVKKYHIAILKEDESFLDKMMVALKSWYRNRVVIEGFKCPREMFEAIHISEIKHKPFDIAILSPAEDIEKRILNKSNPKLKVVLCEDERALKSEMCKIVA